MRRDAEPHNGHLAAPPADRTVKIKASDESLTLSTANPLGTRDEIRSPVRMALIPPLENRRSPAEFIESESEPRARADPNGTSQTSDRSCSTAAGRAAADAMGTQTASHR